jgi:hypothetical protein
VPGDRVRSGVESRGDQFLAELEDQVDGDLGERRGAGFRPPGPRLERGLALGLVAGFELVDLGSVHAVPGSDLSRSLVLDEQGGQDQARLRHG